MRYLLVLFLSCSSISLLASSECNSLNSTGWKSDSDDAKFENIYFKCTYKVSANFNHKDNNLIADIKFKKYSGSNICDDEISLQLKGYCRDEEPPIWLHNSKDIRLSGSWWGTQGILIDGTVTLRNKYPGYMQFFLVPSRLFN